MNLLDLASQLHGGSPASGGQDLLSEVVGLVNNHPGGLGGLVQTFQQGGLSEAVTSWVGSSNNLPVSPDQIQQVLGNEKVQALASKLGISSSDASSHLAQLLPAVIDHLTPTGQVDETGSSSSLLDTGMKVLTTFTGG